METISFYTKLAAVLLIATTALAGCDKEPVKVSGVSLDKTMLTLTEGGSEMLTATVTPADADNKAVTWAVTEGDAVIVDAGGKVIAVKTGTATVTVTTADGGFTAECVVMVLRGVTLNKTKLTLSVGGSEILVATFAPGNVAGKIVEWISSNPEVAMVIGGTVTAISPGDAVITVVTAVGSFTSECIVTVNAIAVTGVTLNKPTHTILVGSSKTLVATVAPDNAADKTVEWTSSNPEVATVTDGMVTAVASGDAVITVITADGGFKAECTITVSEPVPMTMTTAMKGEVKFLIAGTGEAVIHWGDGSTPETVALVPYDRGLYWYAHTFSDRTSRTIIIDGKNITHLVCNRLQLTDIDLTKNAALIYLECYENQLISLDVTKNTEMEHLLCYKNQLISLDVTKNTALKSLWCDKNQLTALDVTKNTALKSLDCSYNQLTDIDVTKNTVLTGLGCSYNQLKVLDVTKNIILTSLYCLGNQLTTLDVTKNTVLDMLGCASNQLTSLDLTKNIELRELSCYSNQLTSLNMIKNTKLRLLYGYNNHLTAEELNALFGSLPSNYSSKLISIKDNPGADGCDRTIATAKGWTVN